MIAYVRWSKLVAVQLYPFVKGKFFWCFSARIRNEWPHLKFNSFSRIPLNKQHDALIDATHVICQPKITKLSDDDYKALEEANIPAISMAYLKAVITEEVTPDIDNFLFKWNCDRIGRPIGLMANNHKWKLNHMWISRQDYHFFHLIEIKINSQHSRQSIFEFFESFALTAHLVTRKHCIDR